MHISIPMDIASRGDEGLCWGVGVGGDRLMGVKEDICNTFNIKEFLSVLHKLRSTKNLCDNRENFHMNTFYDNSFCMY